MNVLLAAALEAQKFFRKKRWRFCIIGGLAVIRWGEPRATQDVDITLLTGFRKEARIIDAILTQFEGRLPNARQFALENRVLLCRGSNGVSLDISLAGFPYEEQVVDHSTPFRFAPRVSLTTASAEDLIILKAFADRDKDWVDIRGIVERQGDGLQWEYILRELRTLCELKEDLTPLNVLNELRGEG